MHSFCCVGVDSGIDMLYHPSTEAQCELDSKYHFTDLKKTLRQIEHLFLL